MYSININISSPIDAIDIIELINFVHRMLSKMIF